MIKQSAQKRTLSRINDMTWKPRDPLHAAALRDSKSPELMVLQARSAADLALTTLVGILKDSDDDRCKIAAAKEILDRAYGKPVQATITKNIDEISSRQGRPDLSRLSSDERIQLIELASKAEPAEVIDVDDNEQDE